MKDRENQFLFESYMQSIEEGRKKQFKDRERKTVVDPNTGEERKESYYEMMMRLKGKGSGPRSRALRNNKEKTSTKVNLGNRKFKVSDKAYEERLNTVQRDVIRYAEASDETKASELLSFIKKSTGMDPKEAEILLGGMITDGYLDEVFSGSQSEPRTVERQTDQFAPPTAMLDTEYDEYQGDDLEDY